MEVFTDPMIFPRCGTLFTYGSADVMSTLRAPFLGKRVASESRSRPNTTGSPPVAGAGAEEEEAADDAAAFEGEADEGAAAMAADTAAAAALAAAPVAAPFFCF